MYLLFSLIIAKIPDIFLSALILLSLKSANKDAKLPLMEEAAITTSLAKLGDFVRMLLDNKESSKGYATKLLDLIAGDRKLS